MQSGMKFDSVAFDFNGHSFEVLLAANGDIAFRRDGMSWPYADEEFQKIPICFYAIIRGLAITLLATRKP